MEKPETGTGAEDDGRRKHRLARSRRTAGQNRERGFAMNRILIIDDDRELCVLIKRSVLSENIEADFCSTGKAGLLKLREREYQLVILDVMMPGMDGFETLEEIRKDILSFYNAMDLIFFTQFIKHCFGDAMLCCYLGFDNSSMRFCNSGEFSYVIHTFTSIITT